MKALLALLFSSLFALTCLGQHTISSMLRNKGNEPLMNADIRLLNAKDSSLLSHTTTDGSGRFVFSGLAKGSYILTAKALGHQLYKLPVLLDGIKDTTFVPVIVLQSDRKNNLAEVVIQGKKPLMQMEMDKTVVNVEAMISSASSNTLEVLEKTPGVTVGTNGEIGLNGRTGVLVLIDGRSKYMSAQDLASYLKSIPAALLDQIELIDNPSARYDAAGNAVINIRLKKNRAGGFTGSVSTGFSQGKYLRSNNSLNLNYNYKKINVFGNIGYTYDTGYVDDSYDRLYFSQGSADPSSSISLFNSQLSRSNSLNTSFGADYSANANTTYTVQMNINEIRRHDRLSYQSGNYSSAVLDSLGSGDTRSGYDKTNLSTGLSMIHKFGKSGRELSADVNYLNYDGANDQYLQNLVFLPDGMQSSSRQFYYHLPSSMNVYTAKADYVHPMRGKAKLEAGFKSSWVSNDNMSEYYNVIDNEQFIDNGQSNHFKYRENINAVYLNAMKSGKYFGVQLGLRAENTIAKGNQMGNEVVTGSSFKKDYTKFFPALFLNYKLDTLGNNAFTLGITRRINRPSYQLLNEFLILRDQYSYSTGNAMLNPQYQYRFELKYQHKQLLRMALSYNRFTDLIFVTTRVENEIFITRPENIGNGFMLLLNTGLSLSPAKWWSLNTDVLLSRMGLHGISNGIKFDPATYVARINVLNQFRFNDVWSAEFGGYYASRDLNGQTFTGGMYRVNTSVQKKILKGQGSLRLAAEDIFHSWVYHNHSIGLENADYAQLSRSDTQRFGFAFTYRFGKDIFSRKNKHQNNALDDEAGRL
ncbi:MAG: outer membrane beta-barrel protein [Pedobacter sp.]|uniref:outer membrane beta-barrel protein n=1 Tax=Pedobacter sp. TaxID=1411316 RepID=UPI003397561D